MNQGSSPINGPHQGAWVTTPDGRDWFYHFQDRGVYGRILHLQPMEWVEDWPVIGRDGDGDGIGEPVADWPLPLPSQAEGFELEPDDDFPGPQLGLCWQWQANPEPRWYKVEKGLQLHILPCAREKSLLWYMPNVLTQMPQAEAFAMEVEVTLEAQGEGDEAGIAVMGHSYSALALHRGEKGHELRLYRGTVTRQTPEGEAEEELVCTIPWEGDKATLRFHFHTGGSVSYGYLTAAGEEVILPEVFQAAKSTWSGAKSALFARNSGNAPGGRGSFHYVRFTKGE